MSGELHLTIPAEVLDAITAAAAERAVEQLRAESAEDGYVDVKGAAEFLSCPESRIYALKSQGSLPFEKDGSRVLFEKSELREYVKRGGAKRRGGAKTTRRTT